MAFALAALILVLLGLAGCGTAVSNTTSPPIVPTLNGDWQFTMASPADGSYSGGLQGGFLSQSGSSATGSVNYAVIAPAGTAPCNSGSATVTGSLNGSDVTLTATAGSQTFTLTGSVSFNGTSIFGTYSSTAGLAQDGSACGTVQTGLEWQAILVPPLTGSLQGTFHSGGGTAGLIEQEFLASGSISQSTVPSGAASSLTGTINFLNAFGLSEYPCIAAASFSGQISGNTVEIAIDGGDGSSIGNIGGPVNGPSTLGIVTIDSTQNGYVLHSLYGVAYAVYSTQCGGGTVQDPADFGSICLGLNSTTACNLSITLTPSALTFGTQGVGTTSAQSMTLQNSSGSTLNQLSLILTTPPNVYSETDTCGSGGGPTGGGQFFLGSGQSCIVTITFTPQCTGSCTSALDANLVVDSPNTNMIFSVPITGKAKAAPGSSAPLYDGNGHE